MFINHNLPFTTFHNAIRDLTSRTTSHNSLSTPLEHVSKHELLAGKGKILQCKHLVDKLSTNPQQQPSFGNDSTLGHREPTTPATSAVSVIAPPTS